MIYFPTTLVLIDDDVDFLNALARLLGDKDFSIKTFSSPHHALEFLQEMETLSKTHGLFPSRNNQDTWEEWVEKIRQSPLKNKIPSCVVTDFQMPHVDGLTLLEKIKNPLTKILLTGALDQNKAIKAFNSHKIDQFYSKEDLIQLKNLPHIIQEEIYRFFAQNFSLFTSYEESYQLLHICQKLHIIELYPLDFSGGYAATLQSGEKNVLFCPTMTQILKQKLFLEANGVDQKILTLLEKGTHYVPVLADELIDLTFSKHPLLTQTLAPLTLVKEAPLFAGYVLR